MTGASALPGGRLRGAHGSRRPSNSTNPGRERGSRCTSTTWVSALVEQGREVGDAVRRQRPDVEGHGGDGRPVGDGPCQVCSRAPYRDSWRIRIATYRGRVSARDNGVMAQTSFTPSVPGPDLRLAHRGARRPARARRSAGSRATSSTRRATSSLGSRWYRPTERYPRRDVRQPRSSRLPARARPAARGAPPLQRPLGPRGGRPPGCDLARDSRPACQRRRPSSSSSTRTASACLVERTWHPRPRRRPWPRPEDLDALQRRAAQRTGSSSRPIRSCTTAHFGTKGSFVQLARSRRARLLEEATRQRTSRSSSRSGSRADRRTPSSSTASWIATDRSRAMVARRRLRVDPPKIANTCSRRDDPARGGQPSRSSRIAAAARGRRLPRHLQRGVQARRARRPVQDHRGQSRGRPGSSATSRARGSTSRGSATTTPWACRAGPGSVPDRAATGCTRSSTPRPSCARGATVAPGRPRSCRCGCAGIARCSGGATRCRRMTGVWQTWVGSCGGPCRHDGGAATRRAS